MSRRLRLLEEWNSFRRTAIPGVSDLVQLDETKKAFHAGAVAIFALVTQAWDSEAAGLVVLDDLKAEFEKYTKEMAETLERARHDPSEVNPDHPVTRQLHGHWHKLCAILLLKISGGKELIITNENAANLSERPGEQVVLAHAQADGIHLSLITMEEARRKLQ